MNGFTAATKAKLESRPDAEFSKAVPKAAERNKQLIDADAFNAHNNWLMEQAEPDRVVKWKGTITERFRTKVASTKVLAAILGAVPENTIIFSQHHREPMLPASDLEELIFTPASENKTWNVGFPTIELIFK